MANPVGQSLLGLGGEVVPILRHGAPPPAMAATDETPWLVIPGSVLNSASIISRSLVARPTTEKTSTKGIIAAFPRLSTRQARRNNPCWTLRQARGQTKRPMWKRPGAPRPEKSASWKRPARLRRPPRATRSPPNERRTPRCETISLAAPRQRVQPGSFSRPAPLSDPPTRHAKPTRAVEVASTRQVEARRAVWDGRTGRAKAPALGDVDPFSCLGDVAGPAGSAVEQTAIEEPCVADQGFESFEEGGKESIRVEESLTGHPVQEVFLRNTAGLGACS